MATINGQNLAWSDLSKTISYGDVVYNCVCAQVEAGTVIPDAVYISSNLKNCDVSGLTVQPELCLVVKKDLCAHIHPNIGLPDEPDDCRHVTSEYIVDVDGEQCVVYDREDTSI